MHWHHKLLDDLAQAPLSYGEQATASSEPVALAALAMIGHGRADLALEPLQWLVESQLPDGQVPLRRSPPRPGWTTALAALAWTAAERTGAEDYAEPLQRAAAWMLHAQGDTSERNHWFGHDPSIAGWAWVEGTHSWLEPTALHVLALSARGWREHPRTRDGRRLLRDRLLPKGGCNYGNTTVLGQTLRPHLQPSGLAMLALGGAAAEGRVAATLNYLRRATGADTAAASLCWALMGLAAHDRLPAPSGDWLAAAARRPRRTGHHLALLLLAALGRDNPLIRLTLEAPL